MKRKPVAAPEPVEQSARALGTAVGEFWKSMVGLSVPIKAFSDLQSDYVKQATELWNQTLTRVNPRSGESTAPAAPITDKRFAAPEWAANPASAFPQRSVGAWLW